MSHSQQQNKTDVEDEIKRLLLSNEPRTRPSFFDGVALAAITTPFVYPFTRLQTFVQTQLLSGNKTSIGQAIQNVRGSSGLFTGFLPYYLYCMGYGGMISSLGLPLGIAASAIFYPFELAQIKLASATPNGEPLPLKELVREYAKNISNKGAYTGVTGSLAKNYLLASGVYLSVRFENKLTLLLGLLGAVAVDNVRRNYVNAVLSSEGRNITMTEVNNQIMKTHGFTGYFRGISLYPQAYLATAIAFGLMFKNQTLDKI